MQLSLQLEIPPLPQPIVYTDKILLIGSCFTDHMSERLSQLKFSTVSNPNGILFNPLSVASSLSGYVAGKIYSEADLFYLNELWNSWEHHTRFSDVNLQQALEKINKEQQQAASFIRQANWVFITLGSAFQYYLKDDGKPVANNHRAPASWFEKKLLEVSAIVKALTEAMKAILAVNPSARFLLTISPVRHIRDGVVDNNRSKARLIEAVHTICETHETAFYFPAYELVIDILRDHRFYDIDFVHPNYLATKIVWERFADSCISDGTRNLMTQVQEIVTARAHKARFPATEAHRKFLNSYHAKVKSLMQQFPFLNLGDELEYFSP